MQINCQTVPGKLIYSLIAFPRRERSSDVFSSCTISNSNQPCTAGIPKSMHSNPPLQVLSQRSSSCFQQCKKTKNHTCIVYSVETKKKRKQINKLFVARHLCEGNPRGESHLYEEAGDAHCLAQGYKSRNEAPLWVLMAKRHYFQPSKYLLGFIM